MSPIVLASKLLVSHVPVFLPACVVWCAGGLGRGTCAGALQCQRTPDRSVRDSRYAGFPHGVFA